MLWHKLTSPQGRLGPAPGVMSLPLVMSSFRLLARKVHMQSLSLLYTFLLDISTSSDPPVANNSPIFLLKPVLNSALFIVFLAHNPSGAKPVDYHSYRSFLLIYIYRTMSVCFCFCLYTELRRFVQNNKEFIWFFNATVRLWKCSGNVAATLCV